MLKCLDELRKIESIQKLLPEMSRAIVGLRDNFLNEYEKQVKDHETKAFKLENKLTEMTELAEKYKSELKELQVKFDGIH